MTLMGNHMHHTKKGVDTSDVIVGCGFLDVLLYPQVLVTMKVQVAIWGGDKEAKCPQVPK